MKTFRFVLFTSLTLALGVLLNERVAGIPPLGKFLSPFQGFWKNAENETLPKETLKLEGLSGPVTVYYDELMIPHIYAQNERDLHFVQGYLTAKDRLWQMDFFSRIVLGRISEVIGEAALDFDRQNRRIGLKKMTEEFYETIKQNEELSAIVSAYSAGVNARIDELSYADYPIEFKLLDYKPEEWSPLKSCLAYAMLSNTLSRSEADLENTNALALFGRELFDLLYPDQLGNLAPVIPAGTPWEFEPIPVTKPDIDYPLIGTKENLDRQNPLNGSNNFAVMGQKTQNGNVLVANEPDLELTLPSIWHASHLNAPGKNVMGVTVPGTPVILIGFNDSISWGVTNSPRDQVDWYSIKFRDASREEYWYNGQWFKTSKRIERFEISGGETFTDTIIYVHHGPVVFDRNFKGDNEKVNYAMRWIAHQPSTNFTAFHLISKANGYDDFKEAMKYFTGPPQNFIFGSARGEIAQFLPGKFPVKWEEQGKFLMDGSDPLHEWKDIIPFDHLMKAENPERGFLSSANQHPVDSTYPYYVYDHHYEYNRNRRINDRLTLLNNIVPKDMMRLQNDNYNYLASEALPAMLDSLDTARFTPKEWGFYKTLSQWDYFNKPDLKAPTAFQLWYNLLYKSLWDEFDTISLAIDKPKNYVTVHLLKNEADLPFADVLATKDLVENTTSLINAAFYTSLDSLENWAATNNGEYNWFQFKNTSIRHILRLDPFSEKQIKIGGYSGIVNAASESHGPSWRMVVEMDSTGTKAWGVYPGSQTGNPGNPLYGHMISKWAAGDYYEMLFGQDISQSTKIIQTQTIQPK